MALKECKECGKEVSTKAKKCPNCGAPIKERSLLLFLLVILLLIVFGVIYVEYNGYTWDVKQDIKTDLEQKVKSWINDELKEYPHCTSVFLVRESSRKYTGFAEFEGGEKVDVEVTTDASGEALFRLKGRPGL